MLKELLSEGAKNILLNIYRYKRMYAPALARDLGLTTSTVQYQLDKFEEAGLLVSELMGSVRIYEFNMKSKAAKLFLELIKYEYEAIPREGREKRFPERRGPRKKGKPIRKKEQ
jgi:DNA-binding transcriptional ArsR family regulator